MITGFTGAIFADRSAWARLRLSGGDRHAFLHNLTTQDIKGLANGQAAPAVVINQRAGVLDWVEVLAEPDALWVLGGPDRAASTLAWFERYLISEDVTLLDQTAVSSQFFLTGPRATALIAAWHPELTDLPEFASHSIDLDGYPVTVWRKPGWFGAGYHFLAPCEAHSALRNALEAQGARSVSDDVLNTWRVAAGEPLVGIELTEKINPWEARLAGSISLRKGCYLGQEVVARLNTYDKVQRKLVGLTLATVPPSPGARLFAVEPDGNPREVGWLTSAVATESGSALGLGFVKKNFSEPDTPLIVGEGLPNEPTATVRALPFFATEYPE